MAIYDIDWWQARAEEWETNARDWKRQHDIVAEAGLRHQSRIGELEKQVTHLEECLAREVRISRERYSR